ncbi:hypothetical protein JCM33374_g6281 [Metschnikowia sp. JCM 33374]|nr:hypothetical protein JCM33374_g6281 [Metschnikowia sp. JCM 33374]
MVHDKFGRSISQSTVSRIIHGKFIHLENQVRPSWKCKRNRESRWTDLEALLRPGIELILGNGGVMTDESLRGLARGVWEDIRKPGEKGPSFNGVGG